MYDVVVKEFTFAISSPDEFLFCFALDRAVAQSMSGVRPLDVDGDILPLQQRHDIAVQQSSTSLERVTTENDLSVSSELSQPGDGVEAELLTDPLDPAPVNDQSPSSSAPLQPIPVVCMQQSTVETDLSVSCELSQPVTGVEAELSTDPLDPAPVKDQSPSSSAPLQPFPDIAAQSTGGKSLLGTNMFYGSKQLKKCVQSVKSVQPAVGAGLSRAHRLSRKPPSRYND